MNSGQDQKINLPALNLPPFEPKLRQAEGKLWIWDALRKKFLVLTPEEWVRQHWINYLTVHLDYPKGLFALEKGMKYNQLSKRTDLLVFDKEAKPYLLVECKAPQVSIGETTLSQVMAYNSTLKSPNVVLSNGLNHIFIGFDSQLQTFIQRQSLPEKPR